MLARSPDADRLAEVLREHATVESGNGDLLRITGLTAVEVAEIAARHGLAVHELTPQRSTLEQVFLSLTTRTHGGA